MKNAHSLLIMFVKYKGWTVYVLDKGLEMKSRKK